MNRYKVIIVEDEKWIRLGLKSVIPWDDLGLGPVLEAADGESALEIIGREAPDIIITDIKMPNMTGLQLAQALREANSTAKIILISAFGEFSYAQSAIKNQVSDYILKPIEEEKVTQALKKCVAELDSEAERSSKSRIVSSHVAVVQNYFFNEIIHSETEEKAGELAKHLEHIGIDCRGKEALLVLFHYSADDSGEQSLQKAVLENAQGKYPCFFHNSHTCESCGVFLFDQKATGSVQQLANDIEQLRRKGEPEFNYGIGTLVEPERLSESYQHAKADFADRFFFPEGAPSGNSVSGQKDAPIISGNHVLNLLIAKNKEELTGYLTEIFSSILSYASQGDTEELRTQLIVSVERIFSMCRSSGIISEDSPVYQCGRQMRYALTFEQFRQDFLSIIDLYFSMSTDDSDTVGLLINNAIKYIQEHYREELYMNQVAKHFYVNPSYFSHIFSVKLNVPFTKYLNDYRIRMSKDLLADATLKVCDIASLVGFDDYRYFAKLFKRVEGITPSQYRNRVVPVSDNKDGAIVDEL